MDIFLVALRGTHRGLHWPLAGVRSIGRDGDIALDDPYLSRTQAEFHVRSGHVFLISRGETNPTRVRLGPLRFVAGTRAIPLLGGVQIEMGDGTFCVRRRNQLKGMERERTSWVMRLMPLGLAFMMVPFALTGPRWRWALLALPLLMVAASFTGGNIQGPRRGELPHLITLAAAEGRAFHTKPVLPRRPRMLRNIELPGSGWWVANEATACWLAGFLGAYNHPDVLAVNSPWLTTEGDGLCVRFEEQPPSGPNTREALVSWGGRPPSWAIPLRLPPHARASPAWAAQLPLAGVGQREIPDMVLASPTRRQCGAIDLSVALGRDADGAVSIDLAADGPHALVAGTTGSGKSELLTTWILGLACQNSPEMLALLLVDFKGGAAFGALTELPHCAAVLTDLEPVATRRALASLRALLQVRELALAEAGCRSVAEMDLIHPGQVPRLLVVVDEFRALADDHPDLMDQLLRLGAQGRSLGIHLIVATQRPAGAVGPELRANMPLRISLRLAEPADSQDVIGSPAAAQLPRTPGRALLAGAEPREFQVAWSGDAAQVREIVRSQAELWPDARPPLPWCPPLEAVIPLETLEHGAIALADHPEELAQHPRPLSPGHTLISGPPGSGRSAAARACAIAAQANGDEVWLVTAQRSTLTEHSGLAINAIQTRLIAALLEHCAAAPGRTAILDDVEVWMAAHDSLHGPASAAALLFTSLRCVGAAGSRIVVTGGAEQLTARYATAFTERFVLSGTDQATAMLAGIPKDNLTTHMIPGRAISIPGVREVHFGWTAALPGFAAKSRREFRPLPSQAETHQTPGRVAIGTGGDPLREVWLPESVDVVIIGMGPERDAAARLLHEQATGTLLTVTPQGWASGWSGELGRIRDTAAILAIRPDLVGPPAGLPMNEVLEPGGPGYAVLVQDGMATPLRLASPRTSPHADPE